MRNLVIACAASIFLLSGLAVFLNLQQPVSASALTDQQPDGWMPQAAYYLVFREEDNGALTLLHSRQVTLQAPLESVEPAGLERALAESSRDREARVIELRSPQGLHLHRSLAWAPRWVRGEFDSGRPGGVIDGHLFPLLDRVFVVRIPALKGAELVVRDHLLSVRAHYELDRVLEQAPAIRQVEDPSRVQPLQASGSPLNRVDLLIMGDGYTTAEAADFQADAQEFIDDFMGISPYSEYSNYVNVTTLFTPSPQSGADHPPYAPNCTAGAPTCCGDPEAQADPLQGTRAATVFDSTFCANNLHRLLMADPAKVFAAAADAPDWDILFLLVNDPTYGGSGGVIPTTSQHFAAVKIAQHEYGHTFAQLADEYESAYPGYPACSDRFGLGCEANVTDESSRPAIKWLPWILPTTPIPTDESDPKSAGIVGLFEGARYFSTGMYRSGQSCIMRSLGQPYCQVPSQAYTLRLYQGGWGVPWEGIRLIEPGTASPAGPLTLIHPAQQVFKVDLLEPAGGPPLQVTWLVDGNPFTTTARNVFTYTTDLDHLGQVEISLQAQDATPLVHPFLRTEGMYGEQSWVVNVLRPVTLTLSAVPSSLPADGISSSMITATVTDLSGSPAAGEPVTFTTSLGAIQPATTTADTDGIATANLTASTQPGEALITAATATGVQSLRLPMLAGFPASVTLNASPAFVSPQGTATITALVRDALGDPLSGVTVAFSTTLGTVTPTQAVTGADGAAAVTLAAGANTGQALVSAQAGKVNGSLNVPIRVMTYLPVVLRQ